MLVGEIWQAFFYFRIANRAKQCFIFGLYYTRILLNFKGQTNQNQTMKKTKLKLGEIEVSSFMTEMKTPSKGTLKGGRETTVTYDSDCPIGGTHILLSCGGDTCSLNTSMSVVVGGHGI